MQVEFEESFGGGFGLRGGERVLLEHQIHDQASEEEGGALCVEKDAPHVGEVSYAQSPTGGTYRGHKGDQTQGRGWGDQTDQSSYSY